MTLRGSIEFGIALFTLGVGVACGNPNFNQKISSLDDGKNDIKLPPLNETSDLAGFVVKGRAVVTISNEQESLASRLMKLVLPHAYAASGTQTVAVTNSSSVSFTFDTTEWMLPPISNTVLDFGNLKFSALSDNDLKVCGAGGTTKCLNAVFRIYTTGTSGAGMYNSAESYGVPITAGIPVGNMTVVGLGAANAAIVQTLAIANNRHVLRLSDFSPSPRYNVKSDFTEAGAGGFSTTLVLEYGLTL